MTGQRPKVKGAVIAAIDTFLGFLIGLALAVGAVFVREAMDVRVRTPEQLNRRGFAVLSEVTVLDKEVKTLKFNGTLPKEAHRLPPTSSSSSTHSRSPPKLPSVAHESDSPAIAWAPQDSAGHQSEPTRGKIHDAAEPGNIHGGNRSAGPCD